MPSQLFSPIHLGNLELSNRIIVAPMCQYSAKDGSMNDWHLMHLGQYAVSGAGLVIVEASGVEAQGRITPGCVGLYSDENEAAMAKMLANIPAKRLGQPEEVAELIAFFASDKCGFVTGHVVPISGGWA